MPQSKWITIVGSPDRLVLRAHEDGLAGFANLARVRPDGTEVWRVGPPEHQDAWVGIEQAEDYVLATSWSCWRVTLSADSGQETARVFTK